ncbi:MAG TPA: hypothetical protein VK727_00510 [Steroidobacteraceae bacterium]|nr:hypothetical protein [Steroidobacteraceae bacterium]
MYREPPHDSSVLYAGLYAGEVVRYRGVPQMAAITAFTRRFVEERLAPHPAPEIHRYLDPPRLATKLGEVQSAYAQSAEGKVLWSELFAAVGLDMADTARDRLMLRFQAHTDPETTPTWSRSTATVGFHRDTWGTNLSAQINWWAPVWPITAGRTFAIHPALWDVPIANNSADFDLAQVMEKLRTAPETLGPGQLAPRPTAPVAPNSAVPVVLEPGEIIAFSSAHAHVGVPNHTGLTRISLETRTVSITDTRARRGAPNVDGRARWVAPGLFRRLNDGVALNKILDCERLVPRESW